MFLPPPIAITREVYKMTRTYRNEFPQGETIQAKLDVHLYSFYITLTIKIIQKYLS